MLLLLAPPLATTERQLWLRAQLKECDVLFVESREGEAEAKKFGFTGEIHLANEHTRGWEELAAIVEQCATLKHATAALISDGGMPVLNDPGWQLVRLCHERGVGVSTRGIHSFVVAALLSSGCSAEHFTYLGYVPKTKESREELIKSCAATRGMTFVCMDTPYRFHYLLEDLIAHLPDATWLSVSASVGTKDETTTAGLRKNWASGVLKLNEEKPLAVATFQVDPL